MNRFCQLFIIISFLLGCQTKQDNQTLVNQTIETFKNELPRKIIFYREKITHISIIPKIIHF